jgi:hypothetical protein
MEKKVDEKFLRGLGFKFYKKYPHDQFITEEYIKGYIHVELTFENGVQINHEVVIEEVSYEPISASELEIITPVLGK